jgi:hypothetical protein
LGAKIEIRRGAMSTQEIDAAEQLLLTWLGQSNGPVSPRDLLQRERPRDVSPLGIRNALWSLVDRGKARVTPDRRLSLV